MRHSESRPAILFDLGNTLAKYYRPQEFQPILERAMAGVLNELQLRGLSNLPLRSAIALATSENREAGDFRFKPMAERFERIFGISVTPDAVLSDTLCSRFLRPIFELGHVYDDSLPVLNELRQAGYLTGIVSNAPWGSPPRLWRNELERLGLASAVDAVILCGDVGWRKPAKEIFQYAASQLAHQCNECVFIGDDLRWDIAGSESVGMRPILIDRDARYSEHKGERIHDLKELLLRLEQRA